LVRIVLVGGPAHGIVLDVDGAPAHITAFGNHGDRVVYEVSEEQALPSATIYAPTFLEWTEFRKALKKVQSLDI
jgi:hypothetical protein